MQWLIDHLAAFIIASTIILLLAVMQLRARSAAIETVQFNAAKIASVTLADLLEQELTNIGAGSVDLDVSAVLTIINPSLGLSINITDASAGNPSWFQFNTIVDRATMSVQTVRYAWEEAGTVYLSEGEVPVYEMKRIIGGTEYPISGNLITSFSLTPRDGLLNEIVGIDLSETQRIDVEMTLVSPLGRGELIEETRWQRQIYPVNLRRPDGFIQIEN